MHLFYRDGEHFCLPAPSDPSLLRLIIGVLHRLPSDVHTSIYRREQNVGLIRVYYLLALAGLSNESHSLMSVFFVGD